MGVTGPSSSLTGAASVTTVTATGVATPFVKTATGQTNTGYVAVEGKTSGSVVLTCADAEAHKLTLLAAALGTGDATLTIPDPGVTDTVALLNKVQTLTNKTFTGVGITGVSVCKIVPFIEDASHTSHTGTVPIPAGAVIEDIKFVNTVVWNATGAVSLNVGDDNDSDGYFAAVNLKATDLLVGELLSVLGGVQTWGGKNGAYLVSATGRMGSVTAADSALYYGAANNIIAVISVTTPASTNGRSFLMVTYKVGETIAAVPA
jgi:hypothetical protein